MLTSDDTKIEQALRAAQRYYLQHATMDVIARELHTSRSTVSRLLEFARESGLVEVRVLPPLAQPTELDADLERRYGIRVHLVPVSKYATPVERHQRTALHAVRVLNSVFNSDMILALSWGTMLREISDVLMSKIVTNCRVVQLNGLGNSRSIGEHYSMTILAAFGDAYNASVERMPIPVFFDTPDARNTVFKERSVQAVVNTQDAADVALFSLGTVENGLPSAPYRAGYFLDVEDFSALAADGAVGDLATTFIRADGTSRGVRMNERTSGPDLETLRAVPYRLCAISGDRKVPVLQAALRGGLITDLIIDTTTARLLHEKVKAG